MNNFEILKQEIQSWYPDYAFSGKALNALKSSVREYIQNENGFNRVHKQELQKRLRIR